ncbi:hypothetical protein E2C01_094318 [Portunus trituberculatus]|uniref:Uncharacterized protein n=1 Tax=Portunus trituberculatus TaxID=210409 RepID=A0A5B7JQ40_PORTR|nr:hypothetical protein [Portunus trituberculatus]
MEERGRKEGKEKRERRLKWNKKRTVGKQELQHGEPSILVHGIRCIKERDVTIASRFDGIQEPEGSYGLAGTSGVSSPPHSLLNTSLRSVSVGGSSDVAVPADLCNSH